MRQPRFVVAVTHGTLTPDVGSQRREHGSAAVCDVWNCCRVVANYASEDPLDGGNIPTRRGLADAIATAEAHAKALNAA